MVLEILPVCRRERNQATPGSEVESRDLVFFICSQGPGHRHQADLLHHCVARHLQRPGHRLRHCLRGHHVRPSNPRHELVPYIGCRRSRDQRDYPNAFRAQLLAEGVRQSQRAVLGGDVSRLPGKHSLRCHREIVHDRSSARHQCERGPGAKERSGQVRVQHIAPDLLRQLRHRLHGVGNSRVVDQDVHSAELLSYASKKTIYGTSLAHITTLHQHGRRRLQSRAAAARITAVLRPPSASAQPSAANALARAAPMPPPAPVITTTLFFRERSFKVRRVYRIRFAGCIETRQRPFRLSS